MNPPLSWEQTLIRVGEDPRPVARVGFRAGGALRAGDQYKERERRGGGEDDYGSIGGSGGLHRLGGVCDTTWLKRGLGDVTNIGTEGSNSE